MSGPTNDARVLRERKDGKAVTAGDIARAGADAKAAVGQPLKARDNYDSVSHSGLNINDVPVAHESVVSESTSPSPSADEYNPAEWSTVTRRRSFQNMRELRQYTPKHTFEVSARNSKNKGKGPDVRNWGAAGVPSEDLDVDAQRREYEMWKEFKAMQDREAMREEIKPEIKSSVRDWIGEAAMETPQEEPESIQTPAPAPHRESAARKSTARTARVQIPISSSNKEVPKPVAAKAQRGTTPLSAAMKQAVSNAVDEAGNEEHTPVPPVNKTPTTSGKTTRRPVAQLAPEGAIQRALDAAGDPPSDSSSSSSSDSSEESTDTGRRRRPNHKRPGKKTRKSHKKELSPKEPREYHGEPDARKFFRVVTEGSYYVKQGNIRAKRQKVAMNASQWTLKQFFEGLFNYCFPLDYRLAQKAKLKRCFQNRMSVDEYSLVLTELFNSIGDMSEEDKVDRLWTGLRPYIQRGLWMKGHSPETSSYDDVYFEAEIIERVEKLELQGNGNGGGGSGGPGGGHPGSPGNGGGQGKFGGGYKGRGRFTSNSTSHGAGGSSNNRNGGSSQSNGRNHSNQNGNNRQNNSTHPNSGQNGNKPSGSGISKPPMSDKKRAELKAAGLCFACGIPGHTQRDCPNKRGRTNMRSNKAGYKLESSYGHVDGAIRFDLLEERADADDADEFISREQTIQQNWADMMSDLRGAPPNQIGDIVAHGVHTVLMLAMPYPGDGEYDFEEHGTRFAVFKTSESKYMIMDVFRDSELEIDADLVCDPLFALPDWYAAQMADMLEDGPEQAWYRPKLNGYTIALGLQTILEAGTLMYPGPDGEVLHERFLAAPDESAEFGAGYYAIWDHQYNWCVRLAVSDLSNPKFDIVNWYRKYCARHLPVESGPEQAFLEWAVPEESSEERVGDIYAQALHRAFNSDPRDYPGDSDSTEYLDLYDGVSRFEIRRISDSEYGVIDHVRGYAERIAFRAVQHEFLDLCADRAGLERPPATDDYTGFETEFGDQLLEITWELLEFSDSPFYEFKLRREKLENPDFNVRGWLSNKYERRERKYGQFFDGYDQLKERGSGIAPRQRYSRSAVGF
ncbi:hypothetical protein C8R43DRAFT_952213 [Mycena crocata]|nr:hypothetical protein C8R43DRAFT_952213 [Mycena crocata]